MSGGPCHFEPAGVGRGEAHALVGRADHAGGGDVDGENGAAGQGGGKADGEVLHHRSVHVRATVDDPRREDAWQGAGGHHCVRDHGVQQAGQAPEDLHAGMEIDRVDQQAAGQVAEGDVADEASDQELQRLAPVERRGLQAAECDVGVGDLEDVPPPHGPGSGLHLSERNAGGPRRSDQRPDARPHHQARHEPVLLERAQHADVGEPLEAAAAEDQAEGSFRAHSLAPAKVGCVTYAPTKVQESCATRRGGPGVQTGARLPRAGVSRITGWDRGKGTRER